MKTLRRFLIALVIMLLCGLSATATESEDFTDMGEADLFGDLPPEASQLLEDVDTGSPNILEAVTSVVTKALSKMTSGIKQGLRLSGTLLIIVLLCGICNTLSSRRSICIIVGSLGIFAAAVGSVGSMIQLSRETIGNLADYSGLMLPVMASAMAISGNPVTAGALQALTALFAQLLMRLIIKLLIPGVYLFLILATVECALGNTLIGELREFLSWLIGKALRILMYIFTAFLSLTGVISGSTDALALKTTKAAVSGMVPVVGSILSDASESLLAGATSIKNTVGVLGMTAVVSIAIVPFLRVGLHYLIMKGTAACSGTVAMKEHTAMLKHISTAMGLLLAMTGTCAILLLISGVCYLKVTAL